MLSKVIINDTMPAKISVDGFEFISDIFNKVDFIDKINIPDFVFVYWPFNNDLGYIKAQVAKEHADKFINNGASLSPANMIVQDAEEPQKTEPEEPDYSSIFDGLSNTEIAAYVLDKTGEEISHMGKTEYVIKRALLCLKQHDKL